MVKAFDGGLKQPVHCEHLTIPGLRASGLRPASAAIPMIIPPRFALLPDCADTRLLVDLTSHANDLSEAAHSLKFAVDAGRDSELWGPLTSHAVTAYVRPFILSKVRTRLDEMSNVPGVPPELQNVHDRIRKYRNTTIAHSQSDLMMPLPLAFLDESGHGVDVWGVTLTNPMPLALAEQFAYLIVAMEENVEQATQPVLQRLRSWLRKETTETIGSWKQPEFVDANDTDFDPGRRRNRTPRFTRYWQVAHLPDDEQSDR